MKKSIYRFILIASVVLAALFCFTACESMNLKYVLAFESNGGTPCESISSDNPESLKIPGDPTRENYIFDGWFWDDGTWEKPFTVNSILDQPISEFIDMKVYAKWKGVDVTVTLETATSTQTKVIEYGKSFTLPVVREDGHLFGGWMIKDAPEETAVTDSDGRSLKACDFTDITLVAKWYKPSYTVKFMSGAEDAEGQTVSQTFNYGDRTPLPANGFTRVGYTFAGWVKTNDSTVYPAGAVEEWTDKQGDTIVFTAKWEPIKFRVYLKKTATASRSESPYMEMVYDREYILSEPQNFYITGYTLNGWTYQDESGDAVTYSSYARVKNLSATNGDELEFTAIWKPIEYTLEYRNDDRASYNIVAIAEAIYDRPFTLIEPDARVKKEGYVFSQWRVSGLYVSDEFLGETFAPNDELVNVTAYDGVTVIITPVWEPVTYKINLRVASGTDDDISFDKTYDEDLSISLADYPTAREHYTLKGFRTGNNFEPLMQNKTQLFINSDYCSEQNVVVDLYPLWLYEFDGAGTERSPYKVDSPEAMENMAVAAYLTHASKGYGNNYNRNKNITACFDFTEDIDMTGKSFTPIGIYDNGQFMGVINGNGHAVTALDIRLPDDIESASNVAFVCDNRGTIRDLRFINGSLSVSMRREEANVGFVTANMYSAYVLGVALEDCALDVTNSGNVFVGAFQARGSYGHEVLENCYFKGSMSVSSETAATVGIISCHNGRMSACAAQAQLNVNAPTVTLWPVSGSSNMNACYTVFHANVTSDDLNVGNYSSVVAGSIYYSDSSTLTLNDEPYDLIDTVKVADSDLKDPEWIAEHLPAMRTISWTMENGYPELGARTLQTVVISNKEQFLALSGRSLVEKYILECDVDLTDESWSMPSVYGEFDGGGHKITGYSYADISGTSAGLFENNLGVIKNLEVVNITLTVAGSYEHIYVGGLVAKNNGTVAYCKVSGTLSAYSTFSSAYVGGIAAVNYGEIYCCYTDCTIDAHAVQEKKTGIVSTKLPYAYAFGISYNYDNGTVGHCYTLGEASAVAENKAISGYATKILLGGVANTAANSFSLMKLTYNTAVNQKSVWAVAEGLQACSEQTINGVAQSGSAAIYYKTETYLTETLGMVKYTDASAIINNVYAAWKFAANAFPVLYFE